MENQNICQTIIIFLINSSGHNANMLSENFEAIGFGIYVNSSGYLYGTQEFIKRW